MRARVVSAAQGARWMLAGWRLFRLAPFTWVGALFGCFALVMLLSRVPLLGPPLSVALTPALWAGLMALARTASGDRREAPAAFVRVLRREARPLAVLGVFYLAANVVAIAATIPFGEGLLADWVFRGKAPAGELLASPAFLLDVALSLLFYAPAMLANWYAPVLVTWHAIGAPKALFFSITACLINWRAFTAYGAAAAAAFAAVFALCSVASGLLVAQAGATPEGTMVVVLPVFAIFACALIASAYASYAEVFGESAGGA